MAVRLLAMLAGTVAAGALTLAAPAAAEPGPPDCGQLSLVCNLLPTMPELDHDLDLTTGQPEITNQEHLPPVDPCAAGCI